MALLDGRVVLITGAGHGIGRGHAIELARHGAKIVANDLGSSVHGEGAGRAADETVGLIEKEGGNAVANYGDVADHEQAGAMVQQAIDTYGRLDVLINNAGIVRDAAIWNMTEADFDLVMGVHVKGTWSMCHHAATYWRTRAKAGEPDVGGRIINTTSGAGLGGNFGQSNYATAKAALAGLTLTLALELYSIGVTVNAVGPSGLTRITATMPGMGESFEPDEVPADEFRAMDPSNSSPLVAWLASSQSAHVTGQVIRSIEDRIILMQGWTELRVTSANGKRWDANKLGQIMNTEIFQTRARGPHFSSS
jgi:NAD(P)-dependent dehydrogenase (short-subunit alcohol dehydrogenase family)